MAMAITLDFFRGSLNDITFMAHIKIPFFMSSVLIFPMEFEFPWLTYHLTISLLKARNVKDHMLSLQRVCTNTISVRN